MGSGKAPEAGAVATRRPLQGFWLLPGVRWEQSVTYLYGQSPFYIKDFFFFWAVTHMSSITVEGFSLFFFPSVSLTFNAYCQFLNPNS